jgi:GntR family transcriptional regulator, rspAB operon transcriptional repressor
MDQSRRRQVRPSTTDTLAGRAYARTREKILKGVYALGAPLSRRQIAEELRMSFAPVSEALQRLEQEGLVESKPRAGTRVRAPSAEDIRQWYVLREALESQAAREFAARAGAEQKTELQRMAAHLDRLYASCALAHPGPEFLYSVHQYHMDFHLRIAETPGCGLLRAAIEREQVLIFNWLFDAAARRSSLPANFHAELAAALANGDPNEADAAMRRHIRFGLESIVESIPAPDSNEWRRSRRSGARAAAK